MMKLEEKIESVMILIDSMKDDLPRLEEARNALQDKISHNESAMAVIIAMGGRYDSTEDKLKLRFLDLVIELIRARAEGFTEVLNSRIQEAKNKDMLKGFFGVG